MQDYTKIFNARGHHYNEAVSRYPAAREAERFALIDSLELQPGQRVADAPAGGGYVADGLRARFGESVELVCIEPAADFAAALDPAYMLVVAPLDQTGLEKASFDAIASLAGLHHFLDKTPIYREWARLLGPGGRLAVADVQAGTGTADFLNIFVHAHTPGGHDGIFIEPGEWTRQLREAGFGDVTEELRSVPWCFPSRADMVDFCRGLFSIRQAEEEQIHEALQDFLGVDQPPGTAVELRWQLLYAVAAR